MTSATPCSTSSSPPTITPPPSSPPKPPPLNSPPVADHHWAALFATGAFGIWSEKTTIGSALSGSLVIILVGLAASNLGIIEVKHLHTSLEFRYNTILLLLTGNMKMLRLLLMLFLSALTSVGGL